MAESIPFAAIFIFTIYSNPFQHFYLNQIQQSITMKSIIWSCVFVFLLFELFVTLILAVPVPRRIRNIIARKVNRFHLGENFS